MNNKNVNKLSELKTMFSKEDPDDLVDIVIELEKQQFNDEDIISLLMETENKDICCWALLKLKYVNSQKAALHIVKMINGPDSRLRELSSGVANKHICIYQGFYKTIFNNPDYYDYYIWTLTDVNPRVTRNINACYCYLDQPDILFEKLIDALKNLKGNFLEYWALEGLACLISRVKDETVLRHSDYLIELFNKLIYRQDELLKEKVAIILPDFIKYANFESNPVFKRNILKLKKDQNYFIKEVSKKINIERF